MTKYYQDKVSLYSDYLDWCNTREFSIFDDVKSAFRSIPGKLREVGNLIQDLAKSTKHKFKEWIEILKDKKIFQFFEYFKFSLKRIYEFVKKYSEFIDKFFSVISEYVANSRVGKWTERELRKLDQFLERHPILKRASGLAICALLIYINTQMVYIGDPIYDFDITPAFEALTGHYSIAAIFAGPSGNKLLIMLATGVLIPTFPWNSVAKTVGLVGDMIYNYFKNKNKNKRYSFYMAEQYKFFGIANEEWLKIELIFYFDYNSKENTSESRGDIKHTGFTKNITNSLLKALHLEPNELKLSIDEYGEDYLKLTYTTSEAGHVSIASPKIGRVFPFTKDMQFCRLTDNWGNYEGIHNLTKN